LPGIPAYGIITQTFSIPWSFRKRDWMVQKTRVDQMVSRLRDMQASTPDVEASAVVSVDGLIIASSLPASVEEDRVSAMSAAMLSLGERIAGELGRLNCPPPRRFNETVRRNQWRDTCFSRAELSVRSERA
jgi:hypothetical protein